MVNKVILIGNVGADPEVHVFESGSKIVRIRIATSERIYNPSTTQWADHTEWHSVIVPHRNANFAETYIRKGSQVYIEGKLRRREWGEGENRRSTIEVRCDEIRILGRRSEQPDYQSASPTQSSVGEQYVSAPTQVEQPIQSPDPQPVASEPTQNPYMAASSSYDSQPNDATDDLPF